MSDDQSKYDSLSEKSKLMDIALKYTNSDMEKAKLMVSGIYNDVVAIKGKFAFEEKSIYGVFYIFLNSAKKQIININALVLPTNYTYVKANIFATWKTFYSDFEDFIQSEGSKAIQTFEFANHLAYNLEERNFSSKITDLDAVTSVIKDIVMKYFNDEEVECQVAMDNISSLILELEGIPFELAGVKNEPSGIEDVLDDVDKLYEEKISLIEKQADYVIPGRVIISPIKGKYINDIKIGDKIKALFTGDDNRTIGIAKKLNAVSDEMELLPITARVKEKISIPNDGFIIYGIIAQNVLVKIVEEENIKIETIAPQRDIKKANVAKKPEIKKDDSRVIIFAILAIGISFILILLFFSVF